MSDDRRALVTSAAGGDLSEVLDTDGCSACEGTGRLSDGRTPCPACGGSGRPQKKARALCMNCKGYGEIPELKWNQLGTEAQPTGRMRRCPSCRGSGMHRPENRRRLGTAMMVSTPIIGLYGGGILAAVFGTPGFVAGLSTAGALFVAGFFLRRARPKLSAGTPRRSEPPEAE